MAMVADGVSSNSEGSVPLVIALPPESLTKREGKREREREKEVSAEHNDHRFLGSDRYNMISGPLM